MLIPLAIPQGIQQPLVVVQFWGSSCGSLSRSKKKKFIKPQYNNAINTQHCGRLPEKTNVHHAGHLTKKTNAHTHTHTHRERERKRDNLRT